MLFFPGFASFLSLHERAYNFNQTKLFQNWMLIEVVETVYQRFYKVGASFQISQGVNSFKNAMPFNNDGFEIDWLFDPLLFEI